MTDDERAGWRARHVKLNPEPGVPVAIRFGAFEITRFEDTGDACIHVDISAEELGARQGMRLSGKTVLLTMDEFEEVLAVLREHGPMEGEGTE